jgi:hypothetical protein
VRTSFVYNGCEEEEGGIVYRLVDGIFAEKCNRERVGTWNAEQRLVCDLLDNYQVKWGRPVRNMTEDVEVRFGLQLIHISDLVNSMLREEKRTHHRDTHRLG